MMGTSNIFLAESSPLILPLNNYKKKKLIIDKYMLNFYFNLYITQRIDKHINIQLITVYNYH